MTDTMVLWHDIECGGYDADLPVWRELAEAQGGPVLDVGAGTGRVALELAADGHEVVALDSEPAVLDALRERAAARGLAVETVVADGRDFALGRAFGLIVVPMQTIQLLGGPDGRASFLRTARAHLLPGGLVAAAIADLQAGLVLEDFDGVPPDMREVDGVVYASRPIALRDEGPWFTIERVRETVAHDGSMTSAPDVIRLDHVTVAALALEAQAAGLEALPPRQILETEDHVGSTVVLLRA